MAKEEKQEREGDPEDTNTITYIEERRDAPLLEWKDIAAIGSLRYKKDEEGIKWLDVEEPLDLVDISEESVYELLIEEMPKCSLNYDFRIKKGDPRNRKIPCMIGCRKQSDLEDGFYRDAIKLGPEYATRIDDEGEVT
uniref:Uncharacterized protein n=1 Tax=Tanacetum cinerariifolium TaxID=118510 RepID=A0A6L2K7D8_TANCI|nr:hypothetical protein [Tanacetum cinerariifolium]